MSVDKLKGIWTAVDLGAEMEDQVKEGFHQEVMGTPTVNSKPTTLSKEHWDKAKEHLGKINLLRKKMGDQTVMIPKPDLDMFGGIPVSANLAQIGVNNGSSDWKAHVTLEGMVEHAKDLEDDELRKLYSKIGRMISQRKKENK